MLKLCVNHVSSLVTKYAKLGKLSSLSTEGSNYLTSQVILMLSFHTPYTRFITGSTQTKSSLSKPSYGYLNPSSTIPINEAII